MKNCVRFLLVTFLFFGCEKQWDDPIPEGATLGIPRLSAELNEEGKIILEWNFYRICFGWSCDPIVEGSWYEVFAKYPDENDFVRIERLGKGENEYLVPNTQHGKPYEFYVTAHRAGQVTVSNTG